MLNWFSYITWDHLLSSDNTHSGLDFPTSTIHPENAPKNAHGIIEGRQSLMWDSSFSYLSSFVSDRPKLPNRINNHTSLYNQIGPTHIDLLFFADYKLKIKYLEIGWWMLASSDA